MPITTTFPLQRKRMLTAAANALSTNARLSIKLFACVESTALISRSMFIVNQNPHATISDGGVRLRLHDVFGPRKPVARKNPQAFAGALESGLGQVRVDHDAHEIAKRDGRRPSQLLAGIPGIRAQ